jgi:site-specific recombinase XerD
MAGVSIKEIQVLAGHKTISMSARYSHLSPEVTASTSERLVQPTSTKTGTRLRSTFRMSVSLHLPQVIE